MPPIKPMPVVNKSKKHPTELRQQSALQKFIYFAFGRIAALWPADSRDWALAMQAELPEMESTQESLHWLAGGIMALIKAWWNGALSSDNKKELAPVKKPGILSALVTVAALALLLIPSANQGLRAVIASWQADRYFQDQSQLLRMAREAESHGDAKTLAFAAMRLAPWQDYVSFSNKAVALDPSLTWIFSQGYFGDAYVPESQDWAARLQAWDPGNGVAYLIQAEIRAAELSHELKGGPRHDSEYLELGRKAIESPRFDSYYYRRLQFDRDIIRSHSWKDPDVVVEHSLRSGWIALWPAQLYSKSLIDEANAAIARGDYQAAIRDAWTVAHFGELLRAHGQAEYERLSSTEYLWPAYAILKPLLAAEGHSDEAQMLSHELDAIAQEAQQTRYSYWVSKNYGWWRTASIAMHFGAAGTVLLAMALLFTGIWLFAARYFRNMNSGALYRLACRTGRFAPAGLLVSLAVLAVSYLPTAESINNFMEHPISAVTTRNLTETNASVYYVPSLFRFRPTPGAQHHLTFWMIAMVFGILTITFIVARNIFNRTTRPKAS